MCIKTEDSLNENLYTVYYLDWGEEYSVGIQDICEMSKEFVYFPATAHKCYIPGNIKGVNLNLCLSISILVV